MDPTTTPQINRGSSASTISARDQRMKYHTTANSTSLASSSSSLGGGGGASSNSMLYSMSYSRRRGGRQRKQRPHHFAMPLSMRLLKNVSGLTCLDCAENRPGHNANDDDHPDLSVLLNYDLQSLQCAPLGTDISAVSPFVLAPMTMVVTSEEPNKLEDDEEEQEVGGDADKHDTSDVATNLNRDLLEANKSQQGDALITTTSTADKPRPLSPQQEQLQELLGLNKAISPPPPPPPPLRSNIEPLSSSPSRPLQSPSLLIEQILTEYIAACRFYGCENRLNAGVMTTLRFSLPCLRILGRFHDADMLALAEILFKYVNGPLRFIQRLDFSLSGKHAPPRWAGHTSKGIHSHGALTLAKVLQMSQYIEEVLLNRNWIGPYGASAIFIACSTNTSIKKLHMRRCRVSERGALVFAQLVVPSTTTALQEVDLSANCIGVKGSYAIERALEERAIKAEKAVIAEQQPLPTLVVDLEGNLVLQEVMNAVTHGLGILLAMLGSFLLTKRVSSQDDLRHVVSCGIYSVSLIVLYTSSTLYHSFFSMQNTKYIFEVFDKCAIYILIAGSYTPFLQIVLGHDVRWSLGLFSFLWSCCCLGIGVEAMCPTWRYRTLFSLVMYLGMGWSALVCLPEISALLPSSCIQFMVLGGVAYTSGVPFFVRNNNLDHAVWHLFVLVGSIFHWCGVYFYVVDFVYEDAMNSIPSAASDPSLFLSVSDAEVLLRSQHNISDSCAV